MSIKKQLQQKVIMSLPLFLLALAIGCQGQAEPVLELPTAPAGLATVIVEEGEESVIEAAPTQTAVPTETAAPAATATPLPTPSAVPTVMITDPIYQVAFVATDDTLNVRSGPGVENDIVGELAPDATGIEFTGRSEQLDGSTWVEITTPGLNGWVNNQFLTLIREPEQFCVDPDVLALLNSFQNAAASQDGDSLAQLVHPERGLRLHRYWWSPEVRFQGEEVNTFFVDESEYDWGIQDGSGLPIVGSVPEIIVPLFEQDIVNSTELRCNDIFEEDWVRLPEGYEQLNSFSYYQPGTDEYAGLDWGKWVVGVDWWDGRPYISYLVHYQWEI